MKKIVSIIILPILGLLLYFFDFESISLSCPFYKITGLYCPGCGISRCLIALLHFEFYQAFRYNMLVFLFLPFFLFYMQYQLFCWGFKKEDRLTDKIPKKCIQIILILFVLYAIVRNTSIWNWLAPTKL